MKTHNDLQMHARALPQEKRQNVLRSFKETELHKHLKNLFSAMEADYIVEVTHGPGELGKDLVIVKKDSFDTTVIGVVVKCGDVSGKTLGDVEDLNNRVTETFSKATVRKIEEVESQIRQARVHPAELASILKKLQIDSVMVIIAGRLSGNARVRIEGELQTRGSGNVYDLEWLVEKFTKFYPQVFFDGQAMDFLQDMLQNLETKNWLAHSADQSKNLSEYFVEPRVSTVESPMMLSSENLNLIWNKQKLPFSKLKSIINNGRKLILAGDPGTGKSAALAKLAIEMLKEAHNKVSKVDAGGSVIDIPIFITAKDLLTIDNSGQLLAWSCSQEDLRGRFKVKVMFVDGLDEVSSDERQNVINKSRDFSTELHSSVVLTSRKIDVIEKSPEGFEKFELLPFEMNQAIKLFENLQSNKSVLNALKDGLDKIRYQVPITPLSMMLLMQVVEEHQEVPSSITELYDRFVDAVLGRYDKQKGIEVLFEYLVKKRFLSSLAYEEFFSKNTLEISHQDFKLFCERYIEQYGWREDELDSFTQEIERAGVLKIGLTVEFSHRSFLDYFSALYLVDRREEVKNLEEIVIRTHFDAVWNDIAFFYVGLKREIGIDMLKKILAHGGDDLLTRIQKVTVGRLLQAGWHSTTQTKQHGIKTAFALTPTIRKDIIELPDFRSSKVPSTVADFWVLMMAKDAYRSTFLEKELKQFYQALKDDTDNPADIHTLIPLLWTLKPFWTQEELASAVTDSMKSLPGLSPMSAEEQASSLLILMLLEKEDKAVMTALKRKMRKLQKISPGVFKAVTPPEKKGFRKPKRDSSKNGNVAD